MVGVELPDERLSLKMGRQHIHGGRHHPTRAAPVRIKIDSYRQVALTDRAGECLIVERNWPLEQNRLRAFSALRAVDNLAGLDAIPSIAKQTAHRELLNRRFYLSLHFHSLRFPVSHDGCTTAKFAAGRRCRSRVQSSINVWSRNFAL